MRVWVRVGALALARHVWFLIKMSVVVSMSMKESSSLDKSCPLNVGYSIAESW